MDLSFFLVWQLLVVAMGLLIALPATAHEHAGAPSNRGN